MLLAPGWGLPFDDEPATVHLDATIAAPAVIESKPAVPTPPPPRKKRSPARSLSPPTPATPQADVPGEPLAAASGPEPVAPAVENLEPEPPAVMAPPVVLPAPTFADRWPRSGRIVYQVTRGTEGFVVGQSEQRWEHDGTRYSLHAETETTGLAALFRPVKVIQDSRGIFDAAGLRPLEYDAARDGKPQGGARFDPEQGRITQDRGSGAAFLAGAQDLLSIFYQLATLSFDVPSFPLTVATGRKVATFAVTVGLELDLETPQGPRRVRHLKVIGNAREDATEIWLDVETRLPLKIRHRDRKGDIFDQIATLIETEPLQ
jgi:hypothetical protein